jgi:hypothetical protein
MGLGDMLGKAAGLMGNDFDIAAKMQELGVDASMLENLDVDAAKAFIEEKGFDLSMLDSLGIDINDVIAKLKGDA